MIRYPLATLASLIATTAMVSAQGSLTPASGTPAPNMKSLQEIWDKLCELDERVGDLEDDGAEDIAMVETTLAGLADALGVNSNFSWSVTTIDSSTDDVGKYASLAFNGDNKPAVAYYNATDKDLKFIEEGTSSWSKMTVHGSGSAGTWCALDFNEEGDAGISYHSESSDSLWFAFRNEGSSVFLPYGVKSPDDRENWGQHSDFKFAPNGRPYIVHRDMDSLEMHMTYFTQNVTGTAGEFTAANWNTFNVMGMVSGFAPSIDFKTDGYWGLSHGHAGSSYSLQMVEQISTGYGFSYADSSSNAGEASSMKFNSSNKPGIAYYDFATGYLKYASKETGSWVRELVDSSSDFGNQCSMVFTRDDRPCIAYYDKLNKDLKYAERTTDGTWKVTTVDRDGDVGQYASIALGPFARPSIAYYDAENGNLKFAEASSRVVTRLISN